MKQLTDKQKAIFDSTLMLIREHGFHGTTMSQVAKKAGVAAGTIYHYFERKDKLISELYNYNRNLTIEVRDDSLSEKHSFKESLYNLWEALYQFYIDNTQILIFLEQYDNSPYQADKNNAHSHSRSQSVCGVGIKNGYLKKVSPRLALVLAVSNIAIAAKLHQFGTPEAGSTNMEQMRDIFWDGIAVRA